ncbi:MAG: hypothetical protein AAFR64_14070 [Pseudomonadota bacterium]
MSLLSPLLKNGTFIAVDLGGVDALLIEHDMVDVGHQSKLRERDVSP